MPLFGNSILAGSSAGGFEPENTPFTNYYYGVWGNNNGNGVMGQGNTTGLSSPVQFGNHIWKYMKGGPGEAANHIFGIKTDGTLWTCGDNDHGALGIGNTIDKSSPVQVGSATNWNQISGGSKTSFAINTAGELWAWGKGSGGDLGDGDSSDHDEDEPIQIGSLTDWGDGEYSIENNQRIGGGDGHTMVIKKDGTLWAWGDGGDGRLGDGTTIAKSSPIQIGTDTWAQVYAGAGHSHAINSDGELYACGANNHGQLGDGTTTSRSTLVQIGSATNWVDLGKSRQFTGAINSAGELWTWGQGSVGALGHGNLTSLSAPTQVGALTNWKYVACSMEGMAAVKTDGTAWSWGESTHTVGTNRLTSPVQVGSRTDYTWISKFGTGGLLASSATI